MLSSGANVIIWDKMLSCGANVIVLSFGANVIIWFYHVMLSSGMITPPYFIFPGNFTHSTNSTFLGAKRGLFYQNFSFGLLNYHRYKMCSKVYLVVEQFIGYFSRWLAKLKDKLYDGLYKSRLEHFMFVAIFMEYVHIVYNI